MGLLPNLVAGGAGELLKGIGSLAKDIRQAITGQNPEVELKLVELEAQAAQAQAQINLMEAQHTSVFVAGWRPFIGWCCGISIAWYYIGHPWVVWLLLLTKPDIQPPPLPPIDTLYPLVLAMLGFGGYRTWEKFRGVDNRH